jgi:sulfur-oxidizing protein SoxY
MMGRLASLFRATGSGASRRQVVLTGWALLAVPTAFAQAASRAGFDAKTVAEALRALGLSAGLRSPELQLSSLELAENGAEVPVTLSWTAQGVRRLVLLSDQNPNSLITVLEPMDGLVPRVEMRVKLAQSGRLIALAELVDGRLLQTEMPVRVTLGGCGEQADEPPPANTPTNALTNAPALPTLLRASLQANGITQLRMRMKHEMTTGHRQDSKGRTIPAWTIRDAVLALNGKPVLKAALGPGISKDPLWALQLRNTKVGDSISLSWTDTRGAVRDDTVRVQAAA